MRGSRTTSPCTSSAAAVPGTFRSGLLSHHISGLDSSVSDPYSYLIKIRIQHFRVNTDPDPIRIQGFNGKKLKKICCWNTTFFWIKNYNLLKREIKSLFPLKPILQYPVPSIPRFLKGTWQRGGFSGVFAEIGSA